MNSKKIIRGLDILNTPIIMCKNDDKITVVYKNLVAKKRIKVPTINNGMLKHIQQSMVSNYETVLNLKKPKVINLNTDKILQSAFVGNYKYNNEDVTIWIFHDMLQIKSYNSFFSYIIDCDEKLYSSIMELVNFYDNNNDIISFADNDFRIFKLQNIFSEIVNNVFNSLPTHRNKIYNLLDSLDIIIKQSNNILEKLGFRYSIITDRLNENKNIYMQDLGVFLSIYVHIFIIGINISHNKQGYIELFTDDKHIIIELALTIKNPPLYIEKCTDISALIKTFPKECFNFVLLNQYIEYKSWKFEFDITYDKYSNYKLRIYADLINNYTSIFKTNPIKGTEFDRDDYDAEELLYTLFNIHFN